MPDTARTLASLQTLLADNAVGDISPQDVRDFLLSVYGIDKSEEVAVTTTATLTIGKSHTCSGTTADYVVTLPPAASHTRESLHVSMSSALTKIVTVKGDGTELIDGLNERKMHDGEDALLKSNGTSWRKVGGKSIPMFCSTKRAAAKTLNHNTETLIEIDTINSESPAGQANTGSGRITIKRTSRWDVITAAVYLSAQTSTNNQAYVRVNGVKFNMAMVLPTVGTAIPGIVQPAMLDLVVGDYLELGGFQFSGIPLNTLGGTEFLIAKETVTW